MTQSIYETQSYPQDQFPSFTEAVVQVSGNAAEVSEPLKWGSILLSVLALAFLPPVLGGAAAFMALKVRKVNKAAGDALLRLAVGCTVAGMVIGGAVALAQ
jgi:hypothetical protein